MFKVGDLVRFVLGPDAPAEGETIAVGDLGVVVDASSTNTLVRVSMYRVGRVVYRAYWRFEKVETDA